MLDVYNLCKLDKQSQERVWNFEEIHSLKPYGLWAT